MDKWLMCNGWELLHGFGYKIFMLIISVELLFFSMFWFDIGIRKHEGYVSKVYTL